MAVSRAQKVELLKDLKDKMSKAQSIIFTHYIGMTVTDVSALRAQLKQGKAEMKVGKKTLMQIAAKELNIPEVSDEALDGPVACIFSYEDPLSGAQIAFKFSKDHPQVELIGGVFEGKVLTKEQAVTLAKIPSKQQLLGMFAAMINSPMTSFARALGEIAKQKEAPAPAAEAPKVEAAPAAEEKKEETPVAEAATPATTEEAPSAAPAAEAPPAA
jgi:large subunit ribosomal protein L10